MAGETLRPTGSTNEAWEHLGDSPEGRGGRSPEQQEKLEKQLGQRALSSTEKPRTEGARVEVIDEEQAARAQELKNQIKQFEHNKQNAQDMLAALERKKPEGAKKREQTENRIRNAKAAIARHDKKLAELRGELAHLTTGEGAPELTVIEGGGEGGDAGAPELTVIEGGRANGGRDYSEQDDGQMVMAGFEQSPAADVSGGGLASGEGVSMSTGEEGESAEGLEAATDRNGEPAYSQETIARRQAMGLEGDPAEEERQAALEKARNEGYVLAQQEMKNILQGRTPEEAIDAMSKDAAHVIQELNQMSRAYYFDEGMRASHERREEEARKDLESLVRRIQMVQAMVGAAAPVELPSLISDEGILNGETGEPEMPEGNYEDNEFLNGGGAAELDTMEPTGNAVLLAKAEEMANLLGDPSILERAKAKLEGNGEFDESAYDRVIEFGSKQFEAEQAAKKSGVGNAEAADVAAEVYENAEAREEANNRVGNKLKKRKGLWRRIKAGALAAILSISMICSLAGCSKQEAEALTLSEGTEPAYEFVVDGEEAGTDGEVMEEGWETLWNGVRQNREDFHDIEAKGGPNFAYIYSKGFEELAGNQEATTEAILDNTEKLPPALAAMAMQMPDLMSQLTTEFNLPDFPGANSLEQAKALTDYIYENENGGDLQQKLLAGVQARMTAEETTATFRQGSGEKVWTTFVYDDLENEGPMILGTNRATRDMDDQMAVYRVPMYDAKGEITGYTEIVFRMNCGGQIDTPRNDGRPDTPQLPPGETPEPEPEPTPTPEPEPEPTPTPEPEPEPTPTPEPEPEPTPTPEPIVKDPGSLIEGISPGLNGEVGKTEDVNNSAGGDVAGLTGNETITPGQTQNIINGTEVKNETAGNAQQEANENEITGDISQSDFENTMNDLLNGAGFTGGQTATAQAGGESAGGSGAGTAGGAAEAGGAGAVEAGSNGGAGAAGGEQTGGATTEAAGGVASAEQLGGSVSQTDSSELGGVTDSNGNPVGAGAAATEGAGTTNTSLGDMMDELLNMDGFQG